MPLPRFAGHRERQSTEQQDVSPLYYSFAFDNSKDTVNSGQRDLFFGSAGPMNLQLVYFHCRTKAKVQALIRAGSVTPAAKYIATLVDPSGGHKDFRANGIAWTLGTSDKFYSHPVICVLYHVSQQGRVRIHVVENDVDMAVVK
jgi:hypothetical protein